MVKQLITNSIITWANNIGLEDPKKAQRAKKLKKSREEKQLREQREKTFGKVRCWVAYWFGEWTLYLCNSRFYSMVIADYQKFYKDEKVAQKYGKMLAKKYDLVTIQAVFDKRKNTIGYMLCGKGKKEVVEQQPSNIIYFPVKSHQ